MAIDNLSQIEKALKLEEGTLQRSIDSDEKVTVDLPELVIRTKEENETFVSNLEEEAKKKSNDSYAAGKEKGVKDDINANLESFGLNLDGQAKTFENFANALKEKIQQETGKPKDDRVKELELDLEKVRGNYSTLENEFNAFKADTDRREKESRISTKVSKGILDSIPKDAKTVISATEMEIIFKNRFNPSFNEDDKIVYHRNGEPMKDESTRNLIGDSIYSDFTKNYIVKPDGGRGEGDEGGDGGPKTNYDKFEAEMIEKGVSPGSEKFQREMNKRIEEKTLEV